MNQFCSEYLPKNHVYWNKSLISNVVKIRKSKQFFQLSQSRSQERSKISDENQIKNKKLVTKEICMQH